MRGLLLLSAFVAVAVSCGGGGASSKGSSRGTASRCSITISELISADVFRGAPRSQARDDSYSRLDPKTQAESDAEDHSSAYLSCVYAVVMNGTRYKFQHIAQSDDMLDAQQCSSAKMREEAAARIRNATHECEDPHRGAYWGFDLVPL